MGLSITTRATGTARIAAHSRGHQQETSFATGTEAVCFSLLWAINTPKQHQEVCCTFTLFVFDLVFYVYFIYSVFHIKRPASSLNLFEA